MMSLKAFFSQSPLSDSSFDYLNGPQVKSHSKRFMVKKGLSCLASSSREDFD
jgi:hypothetical protein